MSLVTRPQFVTRHVAHVSLCSRASLHTRLTCCVFSLYSVTAGSPGWHRNRWYRYHYTRVYIVPQDHCTGVYIGWWCGRGEGGPGTDPVLTARCPAQRSLPHHRPQRRGRWLHPYIALGEMSNIYSSTVNSFVLTYLEPFTQSLLLLPVLTFITLKMYSFKFQVPQI